MKKMEEDKSDSSEEPEENIERRRRLLDSAQDEQDLDTSIQSNKDGNSDSLTREEINKAYKIIENRYPLGFLPVFEVLNLKYLWYWWTKKKKRDNDFESDKIQSLVMSKAFETIDKSQAINSNENLQKISKIKLFIKDMLKKDPISIYGIGILSQFSLMKHLIFIFTIFTLFSIPNLVIYSSYDAMKGMSNTFSVLTLGNFGFTSSNCFSVTKEIGNMTIFWNTGVFSNTIGSYGIMPSDSANKNYWINGLGSSEYWQNRFNIDMFHTQYAKCVNNSFWLLTNIESYFMGVEDTCNSKTSAFFINVEWIQTEDQVNPKRYKAHYIVTICILMSLLFLVMLFYSNGHSQILAKEWDLKNLTAGDYTVWRRVNEEDYNHFTINYFGNQSPVYAYMEYLKEQYEKEISKTQMIIEDSESIKIANISFAFNNYKIISLLEK